MRNLFAAAVLMGSTLAGGSLANAQPAAATAPAAKPYSTAETPIGALIDDAQSRAILDKHIPGLSDNPQIAMARPLTLKAIQGSAPGTLTDEVLAKVDEELAKLGPKRP
jgi:hypothetical protein